MEVGPGWRPIPVSMHSMHENDLRWIKQTARIRIILCMLAFSKSWQVFKGNELCYAVLCRKFTFHTTNRRMFKCLFLADRWTIALKFHSLFCLDATFFVGTSFLVFPQLGERAQEYVEVEMSIMPLGRSGLIIYNGWQPQKIGDFISLSLHNGFVELRFNCGSGMIIIRLDLFKKEK